MKIQIKDNIKKLAARTALHLSILLGAMSIAIEQAPQLFKLHSPNVELVETKSSDELLREAIESTQKKPSVIKVETSDGAKDQKNVSGIESFDQLLKAKLPDVHKKLLNALASDKLALWSVFSNLSTFDALEEIINQPIKAFERETLRSESFGISSGFDQIVYRIHLKSGGTSVILAEMNKESVELSFYISPKEMGEAFRVQRFKDGFWMESRELLRAQVDEEVLKSKNGSSVVLSASVGL